MKTKSWPSFLTLTVVLLLARRASAAEGTPANAPSSDADACTSSYEGAQELMRPNRSESKLLVARESLRTCLRSNCKSWMVADCSKWLSEVETRIPTVVFSAKNTAGRDITDVKVTSNNGAPIAETLDGRSIEMEPGLHDFVFTASDGTKLDKRTLVREGDKAQNISVVFEAPPGERPPPTLAGGTSTDTRPERNTHSLRYLGYGLAGAGVVGLGIGAFFGLSAIQKKNDANCSADGFCDPGTRGDALDAARVSTIAFIAGGVLAAGGVALIILAPSSRASSARVSTLHRVEARLTPGGFALGGEW